MGGYICKNTKYFLEGFDGRRTHLNVLDYSGSADEPRAGVQNKCTPKCTPCTRQRRLTDAEHSTISGQYQRTSACLERRARTVQSLEGDMAQFDPAQEKLLDTVEGTARRLGVGRTTIYELIRTKQIEVVKIGRSTRIPVDSTISLVQRLRVG